MVVPAVLVASTTDQNSTGVEAPRRQLHAQQAGKDRQQDGRAGHVAQVERHRQQVARGLAERGGGDLHHPEAEGDRRHFAEQGICV